MARLYVDADKARFTRTDATCVKMELYGGEVFENIEPRRLFPLSGLTKYISLLDDDGHEKAIIRDLDLFTGESREAIEQCLDEYYLIPKIKAILDRKEKYGILKWKVDTDKGIRSFDIRNIYSNIKVLYDNRVLVRDTNDNRYEIPDFTKLDAKSRVLLGRDL
ncbi:MAG TPA: DUF1854 domain-containing protein [Bacillota bacterium]|nr:DUF1854 domain-containing protein [Bacillota bacterium]